MSRQTLNLTDELYDYVLASSLREPEVLRRLREETATHPQGRMQIAPEQGQFMALLVQLIGAKKTLEVGVFTGYSALRIALALPADGQVVACDVSEDFTAVAQRYWQEAGVAHKIDLRIAPAVETLEALLAEGAEGSFDFAFIDADKVGYDAYYERALQLMRPGGLIVLDNMFMGGKVLEANHESDNVQAIRALNEKLHHDDRIHLSLLPLADGLTLAVKNNG